jgi:diguanylate cyclase (GGDEF)-like protein
VLEGARSNLTCPLIVDRRPIGFLFFTSRNQDAYSEVHQKIFRQIAHPLSFAIDKSRAYQQIIERNHQLVEEGLKFEEVSNRDALADVLNRGAIMRLAERAFIDAALTHTLVGMIMVDIDHFKLINDTLGHAAGDKALKAVTLRLAGALRKSDQLGRYGGEEFLIIIADATRESISKAAERLRQTIAVSPFDLGSEVRTITASFGAAIASGVNGSVQDVISAADRALYLAKNSGCNRVVLASSDSVLVAWRLAGARVWFPGS